MMNNYNNIGVNTMGANQTEDNNDLVSQIQFAEKAINEADKLRSEAETKKKMHEQRLKEIEDDLIKLGVDPNNIDNKILELEEEINKNLNYINENLPLDLLKKYGKI